ncbi:restriction endonuclease subunit S [Segatella bryantii]|uniref:restriction endonuclease subunit S n=1 Tax=Segatella bryantii TaxID=77095 RepID=UPI002867FA79|nr:restriction endonuclease subunit S [Segatella bryantii]
MKAYSEYKNSGVQWIGKVPSHWEILAFKYCMKINNGQDYKHILADEGYPVFGSGGPFAFASQFIYDGEVVMLGRKGTIDKPLYYKGKFWTVDTMFYAIPTKRSVCRFMYYLARTFPFSYYSTATALPSMTQFDLGNNPIALPPLPEQQAITSFLDAKTKPIDDIIAKREKQIELLEEMKSAIISRAVTKGLNPGAKMKDSGIEWIGEIPERWEMCKLKYILKSEKYNIKTGPFGTQLKGNDLREEGDVPVYNQRNVIDNQFHSPSVFVTLDKANELAGFHTKPYDVLITSRGTIGKAAILPNGAKEGILHPCLIALRINQDLVNLKYLLYYINGFEGFAINVFLESNATTIEVIYTDTLKNIFVTLPQLKEQEAIASYLDSETSKIDTRIAKRRKQIELLQEYKQALITAAVTGKIDVREYNS